MMDAEDRLGLADLHAREIENVTDMIDSGVMTVDEGKALLLRSAIIPPDMEAGLQFVETDIAGGKSIDWLADGGYVILDKHGQMIYDQKYKGGYVVPHRVELPLVGKSYRPSGDVELVTEAPIVKEIVEKVEEKK